MQTRTYRRIRMLLAITLVFFVQCSSPDTTPVTIEIPLQPAQSSISGLQGEVRVSGMSGVFMMSIGSDNATVTIEDVPEGTRTFTITFFIMDGPTRVIVAEVEVTRNISGDINVNYTESDFDYDFDADSDEVWNYYELINGTDPLDAADFPTVVITADAGIDQSVSVETEVYLDSSGSEICADLEGSWACIPLSEFDTEPGVDVYYYWSFLSSPSGSYAYLDDYETDSAYFTPDVEGEYVVELEIEVCVDMSCMDPVYDTVTITTGGGTTTGDDHSNSASGATPIVVDGAAGSGDIEEAEDVDYFQFNAVSGNSYTIETGGSNDTTLTLYDTDGTYELVYDDDGGEAGLSVIQWDCTYGGTYYVKVGLYGLLTGTYTVSVSSSGAAPAPWIADIIGLGGYHSCAVTSDAEVMCWGYNDDGELGIGNNSGPETCTYESDDSACARTPVIVSGLTGIEKVVGGGYHTCALTTAGGVRCWGYNYEGQLGNGTYTDSNVPVNVTGLSSGVADITAGIFHTCALMTGGGVKCWGNGDYGAIGVGDNSDHTTPQDVFTSGISQVSAGWDHTCAVTSSGEIKCWGRNNYGQLGDGYEDDSNLPVDVLDGASPIMGASRVSAGSGGAFTCAVISGGVWCWGYAGNGRLGIDESMAPNTCQSTDPCSKYPILISTLSSGVSSVHAGSTHACARLTSGGVRCWGGGINGQLGNGTNSDSYTPVTPTGASSGVVQISAGYFFNCLLDTTGAIECWGINNYGQIGDGTTTSRNVPVSVDTSSGS